MNAPKDSAAGSVPSSGARRKSVLREYAEAIIIALAVSGMSGQPMIRLFSSSNSKWNGKTCVFGKCAAQIATPGPAWNSRPPPTTPDMLLPTTWRGRSSA